jgi:putative OPT family oligopeptide transporter
LSWIVLIPMITMLGDGLMSPMLPEKVKLISQMKASEIWNTYIRYIGAGAVTFGGVMTLIKTMPTIVSAFRDSFKDLKNRSNDKNTEVKRTDRELPMSFVLIGSLALIIFMSVIPNISTNFLSAVMIVIFGFFFVTVSSRIVGLIGSSSNPISGMTIATLMATSLVFVGLGWTGHVYQPIALVVGSIVCIASANAGATSQDLKTGYILGATPVKQQIGLLIGVMVSVIAIGFTLLLLNKSLGIGPITAEHQHSLPAPQATLMATIINGLLGDAPNMPWGLVTIGMGISAVMELCGVSSLAFAVGAYLPLSSTTPIFVGGLVKWFVERKSKDKAEVESEMGPGSLFSSGLIAGGALTGILLAVLIGANAGKGADGKDVNWLDKLNGMIGGTINNALNGKLYKYGDLLGLIAFLALALILYSFGRKKSAVA